MKTISVKYECLSCGNNITTQGNIPLKCSCGNKRTFKEIARTEE